MEQQDMFAVSPHHEIAAEKGADVYFRLDSGAIINIQNKGHSLEVYGGMFEGEVVMSIAKNPARLDVINFRSNQYLEEILANGKVGERKLTEEELQYVQKQLDRRANKWARIKGAL